MKPAAKEKRDKKNPDAADRRRACEVSESKKRNIPTSRGTWGPRLDPGEIVLIPRGSDVSPPAMATLEHSARGARQNAGARARTQHPPRPQIRAKMRFTLSHLAPKESGATGFQRRSTAATGHSGQRVVNRGLIWFKNH